MSRKALAGATLIAVVVAVVTKPCINEALSTVLTLPQIIRSEGQDYIPAIEPMVRIHTTCDTGIRMKGHTIVVFGSGGKPKAPGRRLYFSSSSSHLILTHHQTKSPKRFSS